MRIVVVTSIFVLSCVNSSLHGDVPTPAPAVVTVPSAQELSASAPAFDGNCASRLEPIASTDSPIFLVDSFADLASFMLADLSATYGNDQRVLDTSEAQAELAVCAAFDATSPQPLAELLNGVQFPPIPDDLPCRSSETQYVYIDRVVWSVQRLPDGRLSVSREARLPTSAAIELGDPSLQVVREGPFSVALLVSTLWSCPTDPDEYCAPFHPDLEDTDGRLFCESSLKECVDAGVDAEVYVLNVATGASSRLQIGKTSARPQIQIDGTDLRITWEQCTVSAANH